MQKAIRLLVMLFMIAASFAAFSTPTPKQTTVYAEGSSPRPLCAPDEPCGPDSTVNLK
jgi:hypothetical protein